MFLLFNKLFRKKSNVVNGVDYISNLPDPILHLILSRLHSTKEVVRTRVLSTRWRNLWTSIPSLEICETKPLSALQKNQFKEFVYWVLANRTLDLDSFTLDCGDHCDMSTILRLIHVAVIRKVKQLDLTFCLRDTGEDFVLPRCLLDCDSLEVLKLDMFMCYLSLESFTGSKTLKVLVLDNVGLCDHDSVRSFLVYCPLLEEFSLIDCQTDDLDYLHISCPNLKTLRINNRGLGYYKERLCERLMKAVIELEDMEQKNEFDDNFGVTVCELFFQVSHVEYLSINYLFVESISSKCECFNCPKKGFPESLPSLKTLEITIDGYLLDVLLRILKCSPNLDFLHLIFYKDISPDQYEAFVEELVEVETMKILTHHLKKVEFLEFNGERETLAIAQFLFEHGNALEEIVFSWRNEDRYCKKSRKAMNEVSKFYKASSVVKVITLLKD
ncbi:F-box domain, FBD domain, Leucine-rich repeat domain, L domain-like protein [Artemisia annua]|uniref:F-box domain, FBD domain, Leucine-rich repeat domain, L domain-like protein n=1 Tax=Artemisia annua TaxID=35608 RepID=A0A2U1L1K6_ARTAN|nr:F-box domain, FBD domain, Leucine-rich repeat domain, L domain-like protein [Artemisia annua]